MQEQSLRTTRFVSSCPRRVYGVFSLEEEGEGDAAARRSGSGSAAAARHRSLTVTHMLFITWVEKDNSSKTPQFRLIHLHVPHLRHQFCEHSVNTHTHTHLKSLVSNWYVHPAGISQEKEGRRASFGKANKCCGGIIFGTGVFRKGKPLSRHGL